MDSVGRLEMLHLGAAKKEYGRTPQTKMTKKPKQLVTPTRKREGFIVMDKGRGSTYG